MYKAILIFTTMLFFNACVPVESQLIEEPMQTLIINISGEGSVSTPLGSCSQSCEIDLPIDQLTETIDIESVDRDYYFKEFASENCTNSNYNYYESCDLDFSTEDTVTVDIKFTEYPRGTLTTGQYHTCYLEVGQTYCWGAGESGASGSADKGQSIIPNGIVYPTDISAASNYTCVIDEGTVKCWGDASHDDPVARAALVNPTRVVAGVNYTCAQDDNGVSCWGTNNHGQLDVPAAVTNPDTLDAGPYHVCALQDNTVYCWGRTTYDISIPPNDLVNPENLSLSSEASHSCVVDQGSPRCWGFNGNEEVSKPEQVTGVNRVFVGGEWDNCVWYNDNSMTCWKSNGTRLASLQNPYGKVVSGRHHDCQLNQTISCNSSRDDYDQDYVPYDLRQWLENR